MTFVNVERRGVTVKTLRAIVELSVPSDCKASEADLTQLLLSMWIKANAGELMHADLLGPYLHRLKVKGFGASTRRRKNNPKIGWWDRGKSIADRIDDDV